MRRNENANLMADKKNSQSSSSFSRCFERAQPRGVSSRSSRARLSSSIGDNGGGSPNLSGLRHASLDQLGRHAATRRSPSSSSFSPTGDQNPVEDLEGLLFMEGHYKHVFPSAAQERGGYDSNYGRHMDLSRHPLNMLHSDARSLYSCNNFANSRYSIPDGLAESGGRSVAVGSFLGLNESRGYTHDIRGGSVMPRGRVHATDFIVSAGDVEAERYIARLEEEVQTLMIEVSDRDHRLVVEAIAKDVSELQLQEQVSRGELLRDACSVHWMLYYDFMRTRSFQKKLEEAHSRMEHSTQLSLLRQELRHAEAMLAQCQSREAATASLHHKELLNGKEDKNALVHTVTTTVRSLLQNDYDRLAQLVTEVPTKLQMVISPPRSTCQSEESNVAMSLAALQQRHVNEVQESARTSSNGTTGSPVKAGFSADAGLTDTMFASPSVKSEDSSHLLRLVSRVCGCYDDMVDLYCREFAQKAALAQYEGDIVRFIAAKQHALTWAALYEEKKDEAKHLKEKILGLRGDLRLAREQSERVADRGSSVAKVGGGTVSSQGYAAYAAPYVPCALKRNGASKDASHYSSSSASNKPRTVAVIKRPIGELREEAQRLGVLPASYNSPHAMSPSSFSTPASASSSSPRRQAVLIHEKRNDANDRRGRSAEVAVAPLGLTAPTVVATSSIAHNATDVASSPAHEMEIQEPSGLSAPPTLASQRGQHTISPFFAVSSSGTDDSSQSLETACDRPSSHVVVHHSSSPSSSPSSTKLGAPSTFRPLLKVQKLKRASTVESETQSSCSNPSPSSLDSTQVGRKAAAPGKEATTQRKYTPKTLRSTLDDDSDVEAALVQSYRANTSYIHVDARPAATGMHSKATELRAGGNATVAAPTSANNWKKKSVASSSDETSSSSLSTTSASSTPSKGKSDGSHILARIKRTGTYTDPKSSHMRRSSFDEDESPNDGAEESSQSGISSQARALRTTVNAGTARTSILTYQSPTAPPQPASVAIVPATDTRYDKTAPSSSSSSSAKLTKLKFPSW